MFELVDWIPGLVRRGLEALTGWSPGELQAWLDAVNAAGTWELLRIWLVNPQLLLIWLVSALVVERWFPARPRQAWLNPYQLLDFLYPLLRSFVTLSIRPAGYVFFLSFYLSFYQTFLPFLNTGFLDDRPAPWQALGAFLAYDLASWGSHWLRHKVPWFWHFHTIHHSQRHLNPFSVHREHPVDTYLHLFLITLPVAFVGGDYTFWVAVAYVNALWDYFIHANVKTNLGWLRYMFVSPQFHRIHHSIEARHVDTNFGERLVVWDWVFGTVVKDVTVYPETGVAGCGAIEERSLNPLRLLGAYLRQCAYPFVMIGRSFATVTFGRPSADS